MQLPKLFYLSKSQLLQLKRNSKISNCRFNADANIGHAFGILMAYVGTLRPTGLRRRLTWALGAHACETNSPPRAGLLGCCTWQHSPALCSACLHGSTHKPHHIAVALLGRQNWRFGGLVLSAQLSYGRPLVQRASCLHARSGAAHQNCPRIAGYERPVKSLRSQFSA
jgi:hypothetical protein